MKLTRIVLVSVVSTVLVTGYAGAAQNPQQVKMKTCNAEANQKALKGDARKTFMQTCLSSAPAAAPANSQQEKMKSCNEEASAKALKGSDRKSFMKTCLSAK